MNRGRTKNGGVDTVLTQVTRITKIIPLLLNSPAIHKHELLVQDLEVAKV